MQHKEKGDAPNAANPNLNHSKYADYTAKGATAQPSGRLDVTARIAAMAAESATAHIKPHSVLLAELLESVPAVDFKTETQTPDDKPVSQRDYRVITVEKLLELVAAKQWGICKRFDFVYLYNGAYWQTLEKDMLMAFLKDVALKMGVPASVGKDYQFRRHLHEQFLADAYLPPAPAQDGVTFVNLGNGTLELSPDGEQMRDFQARDFLTYQLPFAYQPGARAPLFVAFLNRVLPESSLQHILAEYFGYLFTKHLKLEKCLLAYGTGANGKSVLFDVINALLGPEHVANFTLRQLDEEHNRALLTNKLANYGSEIDARIRADTFKQLVSGEPVQARLKYGNSFMLTNAPKLIFNANELPREVEHTPAYFRRFLLMPFDVTIGEREQDVQLAQKIIARELPGVLNWILAGLRRLLQQGKFSTSEKITEALAEFRKESDSVAMFLDDDVYKVSTSSTAAFKSIYQEYRTYANENGFRAVSSRQFSKRLAGMGIKSWKSNGAVWLPVVKGV
jgi:putative DNA primase/helicase